MFFNVRATVEVRRVEKQKELFVKNFKYVKFKYVKDILKSFFKYLNLVKVF